MKGSTWMTEERTAAPATGAPSKRRAGAGSLQTVTYIVPSACGPVLAGGNGPVAFHTTDHTAMGRTAEHGKPLGARGAGHG